jgi:hypothetical protein
VYRRLLGQQGSNKLNQGGCGNPGNQKTTGNYPMLWRKEILVHNRRNLSITTQNYGDIRPDTQVWCKDTVIKFDEPLASPPEGFAQALEKTG